MPPLLSKKSKTSRFPVARIKKIMQLDEEVGKLASATPVMISKSLECFLQTLIDETCKEARARGSRKLTAYHLKHTINTVQTLDFLRDLVSTIPDPILSEAKPTSRPRRPTDAEPSAPRKKRTRKVKQESSGTAEGETAEPLPDIGTWKRDMSGGGGTGEGGKGLYDDYEVEDDDY